MCFLQNYKNNALLKKFKYTTINYDIQTTCIISLVINYCIEKLLP